jgi:hypothetical protein
VLELKAKRKSQGNNDKASLQLKFNQLHHRMQALEKVQSLYIPGSEALASRIKGECLLTLVVLDQWWLNVKLIDKLCIDLEADNPNVRELSSNCRLASQILDNNDEWNDVMYVPNPVTSTPVHGTKRFGRKEDIIPFATLWLPSNIPPVIRNQTCSAELIEKEMRLRFAVLGDALSDVRRSLRSRHALYLFKKRNGNCSQRMQTRNMATWNSLTLSLNRHVARYRRAWNALNSLDINVKFEKGKWRTVFQKLLDCDLRVPSEDDSQSYDLTDSDDNLDDTAKSTRARVSKKASEGRRTISWIWITYALGRNDVRGLVDDNATDTEVYDRAFHFSSFLI